MTGGILYYAHLCMRGKKLDISDTDLWEGTSKSAEGHMAYLLFKKAKEEGMNVELNWQDQDSTAELSFRSIFPDGELHRVMLCGGHVGRSHGNNLKEYKSKKVLCHSTKKSSLKLNLPNVCVRVKSTQKAVVAFRTAL